MKSSAAFGGSPNYVLYDVLCVIFLKSSLAFAGSKAPDENGSAPSLTLTATDAAPFFLNLLAPLMSNTVLITLNP
jgi:hypothetical protein